MIARFKLDVDGRHYYWAEVHEDKRALARAARALLKKDTLAPRLKAPPIALCLSYKHLIDAGGGLKKSGELGTVFFQQDHLGTDILAHEFTHAACYWARLKKLDLTKPADDSPKSDEERFAHVVGWMVLQMVDLLNRDKYPVLAGDPAVNEVQRIMKQRDGV